MSAVRTRLLTGIAILWFSLQFAAPARAMTWAAALGEKKSLDEMEQLSRETAIDGLKFDEGQIAGDYEAYFRAIWAAALILRGDMGSLASAERLLHETIEARRAVPPRAW